MGTKARSKMHTVLVKLTVRFMLLLIVNFLSSQAPNDHCMLLALPCGRDPLDVHAQTRALKTGFITYLQVKQAAGIINIINSVTKQVSD